MSNQMEQLSFFGPIDKGIHGATWWARVHERAFQQSKQDKIAGAET